MKVLRSAATYELPLSMPRCCAAVRLSPPEMQVKPLSGIGGSHSLVRISSIIFHSKLRLITGKLDLPMHYSLPARSCAWRYRHHKERAGLVGELRAIVGKPVAVLNVSPRAHHADDNLRETLKTMSAVVVEQASDHYSFARCASHRRWNRRASHDLSCHSRRARSVVFLCRAAQAGARPYIPPLVAPR